MCPLYPSVTNLGFGVWVGWVDVPSIPLCDEAGVWGLGRVGRCALYTPL